VIDDKSLRSSEDGAEVLRAARQFAGSLTESSEFHRLEMAQQQLSRDEAGMKAVRKFEEVQERVGWQVQEGLASAREKAELARLEQAMLAHETVRSYLDAQREFATLCQRAAYLVSSRIGMNLVGGCSCGLSSGPETSGFESSLEETLVRAGNELAERLLGCPRMEALALAKQRLDEDADAQRIIGGLEDAQSEYFESYSDGKESSRELIDRIKRLQNELKACPAYVAYAKAQRAVQELLAQVVDEVSGLLGVDFGLLARSGGC